jgi:hypothetical protein
VSSRRRIALAAGLAALAAALWLGGREGIPRDEAATLAAGRRVAGILIEAPARPAVALRALAALSGETGRPLLAEALHGFAAEAGARAGLGPLRGARLGAALVAALLTALVALAAFDLGGAPAALLAPALLWLAPRLATQGLLATPDVLGAPLWLAAVLCFGRSLEAPSPLRRTNAGLWAGVAFGLAVAVRLDLWILLPVLGLHWLLGRLHLARLARLAPPTLAEEEAAGPPPAEDWGARLRRIPTGLGSAATVGLAIAALAFPWLWADPLHRPLAALAAAHGLGAAPAVNPALLAAAALPAPLLAAFALGLLHAAARLARALRGDGGGTARQDALLLLAAASPLALAAAGLAPRLDGLRAVWPALPVLALLGARAIAAVAEVAWPARRHALAGALGVLVLYPGARALVRDVPLGASSYGEPIGGAAGAAALGWPRQDGGEAAAAVLDDLSAHAAPGARVLWLGVAPGAPERYRGAGLLRGDLIDAASPAAADLAVVARTAGSRDAEYQAWGALGSARAVAGAYLDEVPLVQVFARPGAWR